MLKIRVLFVQLFQELKSNELSSGNGEVGGFAAESIGNSVGASRGVLENKLEGLNPGNPSGMLLIDGGRAVEKLKSFVVGVQDKLLMDEIVLQTHKAWMAT